MTTYQDHGNPEQIRPDVRKAVQAAYVCLDISDELDLIARRGSPSPWYVAWLSRRWMAWGRFRSGPVQLQPWQK